MLQPDTSQSVSVDTRRLYCDKQFWITVHMQWSLIECIKVIKYGYIVDQSNHSGQQVWLVLSYWSSGIGTYYLSGSSVVNIYLTKTILVAGQVYHSHQVGLY